MPDYPEHEKLEKVSNKSQDMGEFFEWLQGKYSLCKYDENRFGGTWWPVTVDIQKLLAEFFEIDLNKIEEEKREMLEVIRKANVQPRDRLEPVEEPKDWYFTFGHGQPHFGYYHVIRGTCAEAHAKMDQRFGGVWSMQYPSAELAGVEEWNLKELK